jgi:hypothetical protein
MARSSRKARRLIVGDATFRWSVGHLHDVTEGPAGRYRDCRETLTLRRDGAPGRLLLVFGGAAGRLVPDGILESGAVGTTGGTWLNLHEPGAVRALLDEARARGWRPEDPVAAEADGWPLFDTVTARRAAARSEAEGRPD